MRTTRAAQVTTRQTQRPLLIRQGRGARRVMCDGCGELAQMLTPGEAAALRGTDLQTIDSLAARGEIHRQESPAGGAVICLNSLL